MNIRPPFVNHYEWTDSIADWAEHQQLERERQAILSADFGPKDKAEGVSLVMTQGRPEQGWPARRGSPEVQPHIVDRLREDYDDQNESADEQVALWLIKFLAVLLASTLAAWMVAGYA